MAPAVQPQALIDASQIDASQIDAASSILTTVRALSRHREMLALRNHWILIWSIGLVLGVGSSVAATDVQTSEGLREVRRHFLDADINVLTFHSIDQIFATRRVEAGKPAPLPRAEAELDFTYQYAGRSRAAADVLDDTYTNALIIAKHDRIVFETYRNQTSESTHFISFSMAKSINSVLIGIAIAGGQIHSVDDPITAYVPELEHSAYDGVTIRQALEMRSGADYHEVYTSEHPNLLATAFEESLVDNRAHMADFARTLTRAYPPGQHFSYSTIEACVLGWVLERATRQSITHFMSEKLWKPAGMESYGYWMLDGPGDSGREFTGGGFNAVARDYLRLGLLMLHGGKAGASQVVPQAWVKQSTTQDPNIPADAVEAPFGYAYQWWTLQNSSAFMALGLQGQTIYIDPATDTVVVKLSFFPPGNRAASEETLAFLKAASNWQPH